MLNDAKMAKVDAQRQKMAEIKQEAGTGLFGTTSSPALQEFIDRINAGKGFKPEERARMKELAKLRIGQQITTEDAA